MKNRVCKLSFHTYKKAELDTFANGVSNGIYTNPTIFATPPIPLVDFTSTLTDYNVALADYDMLGKTKKTGYTVAKTKLIDSLDALAVYVNGIANGDVSIIILAGFEPTSGTIQAAPVLEKIVTIKVTPTTVNGRVIIETPAITGKGVSSYGLILVSGAPLTINDYSNGLLNLTATNQKVVVDFTKGRKKIVNGLDSSISYYGYMFAVNASGVSPLSAPFSVKCI